MPIDIENDSLDTAIQKLKARENSLRRTEELSGMGSWEVNLKTNKSIWSDQSYKIYGLDKESTEPTLELFLAHILPEDLPTVREKIQDGIATGLTTSITCRIRKKNGDIATISLNGQMIKGEDGLPSKLLGTTQDITYQIALKDRAKELSELIERSPSEVYIVNFDTLNYVYVNYGATKTLGYTSSEFLKMNVRDVNPYLTQKMIDELKKASSLLEYVVNRTTHQKKDGTQYEVQSSMHRLTYNKEECFVIFDTDVSKIVELEAMHKKQAKILEHIHDSVISTDTEGLITSWNNGSKLLFGYEAKEMIGRSILDIYDLKNESTLAQLFGILHEQDRLDIEAFMTRKDASRVICDISLSVLKNDDGTIDGYVGYIQDITEKKETQKLLVDQTKKLRHQAHHDTLTDLPNRTLFKDRLSQTIVSAKRNNEKFALLFIDLDQFKKINDSLGHHIGDEVLIEAAKRLSKTIREEDTLARLGGDEFTIIIKDVKNIQSASTVAQKIVNIMKDPLSISIHTLYISSSIGISIYPDDATNEDDLIKYADAAMYKAKDEGRDNYQFYSADMTVFAFERVVMESSLRVAIKEEQFVVYFQPQFEAKTGNIIGMEALVRWNHPALGLVPPAKFIPIAEESGLIIPIDRIVMKKAMAQYALWYKEGLNPGVLALNLAMKQLNEKDFISQLLSSMNAMKFNPTWLELEVTEGQVMDNPEASIEKLKQISEMGIEIAIDDFGTGYSSLSYLKKLPLDKLKIDQSFIRDIPEDEDDMAITKAIIALGKSLNLKLIAEGVETKAQKDFLIESGCDMIQGYYYSRPLPVNEITELLVKATQT